MVNKKGWIRIVEATIAILIIIAAIFSVSEIRKNKFEEDLAETINPLLENVAKNNTMREKIILDNDTSEEAEDMIREFIAKNIRAPNIGYDVKICPSDSICSLDKYPEDAENVYAGSRIISSTLTEAGEGPKKISLFLWIKT